MRINPSHWQTGLQPADISRRKRLSALPCVWAGLYRFCTNPAFCMEMCHLPTYCGFTEIGSWLTLVWFAFWDNTGFAETAITIRKRYLFTLGMISMLSGSPFGKWFRELGK